jgi:hypothetical protein
MKGFHPNFQKLSGSCTLLSLSAGLGSIDGLKQRVEPDETSAVRSGRGLRRKRGLKVNANDGRSGKPARMNFGDSVTTSAVVCRDRLRPALVGSTAAGDVDAANQA